MNEMLQKMSLGECLTLINGRAYKRSELLDEGTPVIRIQNLNNGRNWYYSDLELPEDKYCSKGDLLFAWSATFGPFIWNGEKGIYHYHIWKVIPNEEFLDKGYAYYMLESITEKIKSAAHGSSMPHYGKGFMEKLKVNLPQLDEQKRIAAILNKADEIQHDSETTKEMREQVIRSLFLEMFGDPANPETQWDRKPFGGLMECKNRIRVPVKKSERETTEGTHPYYGASGIVDYVDDYLFEGEHLLISEDGANLVARVTPIAFIATGQFWVNNHAHVFVENGCLDAVYCETLFSLLDLSNHITGSAQPKLNKGNLDKIMIPVPPLEIQTKFRQIIENISKIWGRIDERNSALMDNSNSLTQELIV